jgi:4-hydroxy-3-polyprenylbenzoate decarboxylase
MAYRDFQHFIETLKSKGELREIDHPVSPTLEITEIADRVMKKDGPALLFTNVVGQPHRLGTPNPNSAVIGNPTIRDLRAEASLASIKYDFPVAINTMGSRRRMSLALSCEDFEEHAERIGALLKPELPKGPAAALAKLIEVAGELKGVPPKETSKAKCQEIVWMGDEIDLTKLPILTCWPEDGGPFVTLPLVFTHDPNTGKRNVGMYRVQLFDKKTCGMHWQMHKTGMRQMEDAGEKKQKFEVCVVLGGDPSITFGAISPLPPGIDEINFAGFLRRERISMVKAKTVDIMVPADAEVVIEGYIDPGERRLEGPFGDHTGYYSLADQFPVLHVTAVTMREKAVYPATIVGVPPMEDGWMGKAVERIFMPMIQLTVPEIIDMNLPVESTFHNLAIIKIRKKYPGHAFKIMNAVWGLGQLAFTKIVIVVDEDCDVQNLQEVLFRFGANLDPGRDVLVSKGPLDQLDHAAQYMGFGGKIGFDCTHKWPGENGFNRPYPKLIKMDQDIVERVDKIWSKLGL